MTRKPLFVFICDSYFDYGDAAELSTQYGLTVHDNLDFGGAGGSGSVFIGDPGERPVDAENLLVFTGSFHGSVEKAVAYANEIKAANPAAKIYFRSSTETCDNPVFEKSIRKRESEEEFHRIIKEFVESVVGQPA